MNIALRSPGMYFQKPGAVALLGQYICMLGSKALFVTTQGSFDRYGSSITAVTDVSYEIFSVIVGRETTMAEIEKVVKEYENLGCDLIIGFGGGKTLDTARAAADMVKCPLIIVPTVSSNDAPCSALSVIHDDDGAVIELRSTKRNPDVVLVDTDILIAAPERLFVSGMGDALATYFEAEACRKSGAITLAGAVSSDVSHVLSKLCLDTLLNCGASALHAVRSGISNDDFDRVVQASIYLSGVGFESGGVAAAHAINDGFSPCPEAAHLYHGEIVGFGTLCMLMLQEADSDTVEKVLDFMCTVGLPVSFEMLGIKPDDELLLKVAETACSTPVMSNMPFEVTSADVVRAMLKADLIGRNWMVKKEETTVE